MQRCCRPGGRQSAEPGRRSRPRWCHNGTLPGGQLHVQGSEPHPCTCHLQVVVQDGMYTTHADGRYVHASVAHVLTRYPAACQAGNTAYCSRLLKQHWGPAGREIWGSGSFHCLLLGRLAAGNQQPGVTGFAPSPCSAVAVVHRTYTTS